MCAEMFKANLFWRVLIENLLFYLLWKDTTFKKKSTKKSFHLFKKTLSLFTFFVHLKNGHLYSNFFCCTKNKM